VSKGINDLTGTRSAPTVINAAYLESQFWDGRQPDLEGQSTQPFVNPVEMGLPDHDAVVDKVRADADYVKAFKAVFGVSEEQISIDHVAKAIASFERTIVAGDSDFDKWFYAGEDTMSEQQIRGYNLYIGKGRCVSCHVIEQTQALFTDNKFHNIGVGFKRIRGEEAETAAAFLEKKRGGADVDITVLTEANMSELGRFAVTENPTEVGAFKTSTLRNIALTQPYMHDGSLETLEDVVDFYNNGGRVKEDDPVSGFQSGGIRPLSLTDQEKQDLVEFMKALTSPSIDKMAKQ
jgi:cytochrome c peroxidase